MTISDNRHNIRLHKSGGNDKVTNWKPEHLQPYIYSIGFNEDGSEGWAVGVGGVVLHYYNMIWERDTLASSLTKNNLKSVWFAQNGLEGWAVGHDSTILHYKDNQWTKETPVCGPIKGGLSSICMASDGSEGWAGGQNGLSGQLYQYKNHEWQLDTSASTLSWCVSEICLTDDGKEGWALGGLNSILHYQNDMWQVYEHDIPRHITSICISSDGSRGWAMSADGVVMKYQNGKWQKDTLSSNIYSNQVIYDIWMTDDGREGWAVGGPLLLHYEKGMWEKVSLPLALADNWFHELWLTSDGRTGWACGDLGIGVRFENHNYQAYNEGICIPTIKDLNSVSLNRDGSDGWAVGNGGVILHYESDTWRKDGFASSLTTERLNSVWLTEDGFEGWAVGDSGIVLQYREDKWIKDSLASSLTENELYSVWLSDDGKEGWAVGDNCLMLKYQNMVWQKDTQSSALDNLGRALYSVWLTEDGREGWAAGHNGLLLRFQNRKWLIDTQITGRVTGNMLLSIWLSPDGTNGWLLGRNLIGGKYEREPSVVMEYKYGRWVEDVTASTLPRWLLYNICMNTNNTEGWAVGDSGMILRYYNNQWSPDKHTRRICQGRPIRDLWLTPDGGKGWAVGNDGLILHQISTQLEIPTLLCNSVDQLNRLNGECILQLPRKTKAVNVELIDEMGTNRLPYRMYSVSHQNSDSMNFIIEFTGVPNALLEELKGEKCYFQFTINYSHHLPLTAKYKTNSFTILARPNWHYPIIVLIVFVCFNLILIVLAIYINWIRRVLFHIINSQVLGSDVGKYIVIVVDLIMLFVKPLRLAMFRKYRKTLCKNKKCNLTSVSIKYSDNSTFTIYNKSTFDELVEKSYNCPLLITSMIENERTSVLKNWESYAASCGLTPIYIYLNDHQRPEEEAKQLMYDLGDIVVSPKRALEMLRSGGFLILLDGLNNEGLLKKAQTFVSQVSSTNSVIISIQTDVEWDTQKEYERTTLL